MQVTELGMGKNGEFRSDVSQQSFEGTILGMSEEKGRYIKLTGFIQLFIRLLFITQKSLKLFPCW